MGEPDRTWQWRYQYKCPMPNCGLRDENFGTPDEAMVEFKKHMGTHAFDNMIVVTKLYLPKSKRAA